MTVLPVIERELRAEARSRLTYWLRVLVAGAAILTFGVMALNPSGGAQRQGALLFLSLNETLYWCIVLLVPLLTADCVSREKREGTLGLLFLTPLRAQDIIVGKSLIHGLRGANLVWSVLPIMALPYFLGGVATETLLFTATGHASTLCLSLAAGIHASTRNTEWLRALVHAVFGSAGANVTFQLTNFWSPLTAGFGTVRLLLAAGLLVLVTRWAARHLRAHWQRDTTAPATPGWVRHFARSDFWRHAFRWNKARTLDRNPIAWLQEYSWTARLTKWGWCILLLAGECYVVISSGFGVNATRAQVQMAILLGLGIAFSATASFRREWQMGALELLLVTPLSAAQLIRGRVWGIWCHFFPAAAILLFCWAYGPFQHGRLYQLWMQAILAAYLALPLIGLFFALTRLNFLLAWVLCSLTSLSVVLYLRFNLPVTGRGGGWWWNYYTELQLVSWLPVPLAGVAGWLLYRNLTRRYFVMERTPV